MEWILNALANVILEALNDMLRWTTKLMTGFSLTFGETGPRTEADLAGSVFDKFSITGFGQPILILAMFIVIMTSVLKLYQSMGGPFTQSEEPGVIAIRTIFAGVGVILSYKIFVLIERGFNSIYTLFVGVYTGLSEQFNSGSWLPTPEDQQRLSEAVSNARPGNTRVEIDHTPGSVTDALSTVNNNDVFNFFGGDKLINPENAAEGVSLGIVIIEVVIGCTLMICLFKLALECYERYVLIGVMYITAPLAFSTLVSKQSQVFKNWCQMLVCQFILMCTNLIFIGGFVGAWYKIYSTAQERAFVFNTHQEYLTTMFIMIGWLLAGQKMDEHLRSLGLSASTTGAGIMGAMMGGAGMTMAAIRTMNGAGRFAAKRVNSATKGVSKVSDGIFGGGPEKNTTERSNPEPIKPKAGGESSSTNIGSPDNPASGGSISQLPSPPGEKSGEALTAADVAQANKAAFDQVSKTAGDDANGRPIFDSSRVSSIDRGPVPNGSGERSIATTDSGAQAHIYTNRNDAKAAYNKIVNNPNVSVSAFAEAKVAGQDGAHFVVSPNRAPAPKPSKPGGIAGGGKGGTNSNKKR